MNKRLQFTTYIPVSKLDRKYLLRLKSLALKKERTMSYLLLEALDRYLEEEEHANT